MITTNNPIFQSVCDAVFLHLGLQGELFVEVDLVDVETMHQLNLEMRQVDKPTDVLSFGIASASVDTKVFCMQEYKFEYSPQHQAILLGSIVICDSIAQQQALEYGQTVVQEQQYLFMHGLLHLLGYDHIDQQDKLTMRANEKAIVQILGQKNNG